MGKGGRMMKNLLWKLKFVYYLRKISKGNIPFKICWHSAKAYDDCDIIYSHPEECASDEFDEHCKD